MFVGSFLSCSIDASPLDTGKTEYVEITNGIFDEVYMDSDVEKPYDMLIPEWDYSTLLHAKFKNNLLAGNVDFTLDSISNMFIKRRMEGSYKWVTLHNVPIVDQESLNFFFNDISAASNTKYDYAAVPIINGVEGTYQVVSCETYFEGAFIIDPTHSYQLLLNMDGTNLSRNNPSEVIEPPSSRYPYVNYYSMQRYEKFSLSGIFIERIGDYDWDISHGWKYRRALRDFATNHLTKIVKFYDGRLYMACVVDSITENATGHPDAITTTMQFVEVGDPESNSDLYYHGFISYLEVGV